VRAAALVAALGASTQWTFAVFVGANAPATFSVCEQRDDGSGEARTECEASDIRLQGAAGAAPGGFGFAVATGRLDGDDLADVVVGDPSRNRVYVFFGRPSATAGYGLSEGSLERGVDAATRADIILEPSANVGSFGFSVAVGRPGDATGCAPGDEAAPLLIGAPGDPGAPGAPAGTVFYFPPGSLCLTASNPASTVFLDASVIARTVQSTDPAVDDEFGYSVAFGRILSTSGDGEDVIVGARGALAGAGRVTVFPVSAGTVLTDPAGALLLESAAGDGLGEVLAVGDLDQDFDEMEVPFGERDDLAIGAVGHANGKVLLVQGPLAPDGASGGGGTYRAGSDLQLQSITGERAGDFFGYSLAVSTRGDLLVGAIFADNDPTGDPATNVASVIRSNAGKAYLWRPGIYAAGPPDAEAASAAVVLVARRSGDQLGFAVGFGDVDGSGTPDLIVTARREDGRGLTVNEIDRGTAYISFTPDLLASPVNLGSCGTAPDCAGAGGMNVLLYGGDRANNLGDEIGFALATGNLNGDTSDDLVVASATQGRVYLVTLEDTDDDRATAGRNLRDEDDDGDEDLDATDCDRVDPAVNAEADEILCNDIDDNCNGLDDDAPDTDGDDFDACGDDDTAADCDDDDPTSHPGASEQCDGNDNDCNTIIPMNELDDDDDTYAACSGWDDSQGDDLKIVGGGDCDDDEEETFPGAAPREADPGACRTDSDGDGWGDITTVSGIVAGTDCNDRSPLAFPGAAERDSLTLCMEDLDEDGYGNASANTPVADGTDCDDADKLSFPGAPELCDGNNNDCANGIPDDETDDDLDRWVPCAGWDDTQRNNSGVLGGDDCNDDDDDAFPGAGENEALPGICLRDGDGDGYGEQAPLDAIPSGTDCDDRSAFTFPGAAPQDGPFNCMKDADGDDYGDEDAVLPIVKGTDCDDGDEATFLSASEIADDGVDQDCNGFDTVTCFQDLDRDGVGGTPTLLSADGDCGEAGEADLGTDCDDGDAGIFPGQGEVPGDGIDQDCSGSDAITCFADLDHDGFGGVASTTVVAPDGACDAADGESRNHADCDDGDPKTYFGAPQICDGNDNACGSGVPANEKDVDGDRFVACLAWDDTQGDNPGILGGGDCDETSPITFPGVASREPLAFACMRDVDGDGFGDSGAVLPVVRGTDCDDGSAVTFPGAASIDGPLNCMKDADGDNYGDASVSLPVVRGSDCDDSSLTAAATFPGAAASEANPGACRADADGDGFGDLTPPPGVTAGTDCDDDSPAAAGTHPGATEACDGDDNNCDGSLPANEADGDADGYVTCQGWDDVQGNDAGILGGGDCDAASGATFSGAAALEPVNPGACRADADGDGYGALTPPPGVTAGTDCDDGSATTFPGAAPLEPTPGACRRDADADDYGDDTTTAPVAAGTDCNDGDRDSFPGAPEVPNDGFDQDCDPLGMDSQTCFEDLDGDGFGTANTVIQLDMDCTDPGESPFDTDCDDALPGISPGATEIVGDGVDQDCNGADTIACNADADRDGFGSAIPTPVLAGDGSCDTADGESLSQNDCNDANAGAFPGAPETPDDGIDQDCSGTDTIQCFLDADSDGFGNDDGTTILAGDGSCDAAQAEAGNSDDCDDNFASVRPGAPEVPDDGLDQDCSGSDTVTCFVDADGDGFGTDLGATLPASDGTCDAEEGESETSDDCNDGDPQTHPGAPELPGDGVDQDCSGADSLQCFVDTDRDGYGSTATVPAGDADCADPGESGLSTDCDDANPAIYPGAPETPGDNIDQDCNGHDTISCFADADQDGFGNDGGLKVLAADGACDKAQGEAASSTDCDDTDPGIRPNATDILDDGVDQNCSGTDSITCYFDGDKDGFGLTSIPVAAHDGSCDQAAKEAPVGGDCNDSDPGLSPGDLDIPGDGIDQDCDGADSHDCFRDADGDGFGGTNRVTSVDADCEDAGESSLSSDCDDGAAAVFPGAPEVLGDGVDQNCNGFDAILCILDADRDGFGTDQGTTVVAGDSTCDSVQGEAISSDDCNDGDPGTFPGAAEVPDDEEDQDCNGTDAITCFVDADGDGFGGVDGITVVASDGACDSAQGEAATRNDCNDGLDSIFPGAAEMPNDGVDQDCDGVDSSTCFEDLDGDGFGTSTTLIPDDMDCTDAGESPFATDCDDDDATLSPAADEVVDDGIDQDCSGDDTITCFVDADEDGSGNALATTVLADDGACDASEGESSTSDDCDETDPNTFPGAPERCDGNPNTCAGTLPADETDPDLDGYVACAGWDDTQGNDGGILGGGDCGASDPLIHPGIASLETFAGACMKDHDGDGYGDVNPPAGVARGTDCDDGAEDTFPGAAAEAPFNCMRDRDADGFGDASARLPIVAGTDCNDSDPATRPGALERCDGNDNSCDGFVPSDEKDGDLDGYVACVTWDDVQGDNPQIRGGGDCVPGDGATYPGAAPNEAIVDACMQDADGDDFGDLIPPAGALAGSDCDDSDLATFPGAAPNEAFPGACMRDRDGDDFGDLLAVLPVIAGTDCDDADGTRFPGAPELCGDAIDSNCDGADPSCAEASAQRPPAGAVELLPMAGSADRTGASRGKSSPGAGSDAQRSVRAHASP